MSSKDWAGASNAEESLERQLLVASALPPRDTRLIVMSSISCQLMLRWKINRIARAAIHEQIAPEIVAFGIAVNIRVVHGIPGNRLGHIGGLPAARPIPSPEAVRVFLVIDGRHCIQRDGSNKALDVVTTSVYCNEAAQKRPRHTKLDSSVSTSRSIMFHLNEDQIGLKQQQNNRRISLSQKPYSYSTERRRLTLIFRT